MPSFQRVQAEGVALCRLEDINDDLPMVKIGFLNMMPDAALAATERQFLRLIGANSNVNSYFYPFSINGVERSEETQEYIKQHYIDFTQLKSMQVDALVITGANVSQPLLINESFWSDLEKVLIWAKDNIRSTLCSCLATHAAVKVFYDINRKHLGDKCWGVFPHKVINEGHALLKNVAADIDMCHSRFNDISYDDFKNNDVDVLIQSQQAGVQLAAECDLSVIYFQGHPEYDGISLLKEYKREIIRYLTQQREDYPPVPASYFDESALNEAATYKKFVTNAGNFEGLLEEFPEAVLQKNLINPWKKPALTIFSNWLDFLAGKKA